jgi:glycosyltransferase involved in cell wall biosynthesis
VRHAPLNRANGNRHPAAPARGRVALMHDFLVDVRGAERVFAVMCDLFPDADVFTGVYGEAGTQGRFAHRRVRSTYLQRLRPSARTFRVLLPLYPRAVEALDLRGYDLVVSSSSAWAHGVRVDAGAVHVCYCHNAFRYAWDEREATLRARNPATRAVLAHILERWRAWDRAAAQRVDRYIANSDVTRERIARCFGRESEVVYPPVEVDRFAPGPVGNAYVTLSELMRHKRLDVAVRAFNRLRLPLIVVGDGPDARRLARLAGPTVTFTGRVSDERVAQLLSSARALVVPGIEEFGIAAVEAQAAGRPVIGVRAGGLRETVIEGETGALFEPSDPDALAEAVLRFDALGVDPAACVANARRFARETFAAELRRVIEEAIAARHGGGAAGSNGAAAGAALSATMAAPVRQAC